jgi:uncharacterized protein YjbI with pentapeptide repeats
MNLRPVNDSDAWQRTRCEQGPGARRCNGSKRADAETLLRRCSEGEKDFSGIHLERGSLTDASLRVANLYGANLCAAMLEGLELEGADLTGAIMPDRVQKKALTQLKGFTG